MKKNKNIKAKKVKKILITILLLMILITTICFIYSICDDTTKNNTIRATRIETEEEYGQNKSIKYTIKIKDYLIDSATKEITFDTEEEAEQEYRRYEIINKYERREIGLELKKKKLILTMPEKQLEQDLEYKQGKITLGLGNDESIEIVNQDAIVQALQQQGYSIK